MRGGVFFAAEGVDLYFELELLPLEGVDCFGGCFARDADVGAGFVDEVYCGVWEAFRCLLQRKGTSVTVKFRITGLNGSTHKISMSQRSSLIKRPVHNANSMVRLVLLTNPSEDRDSVDNAGLVDEDLSKTTLERGVLLDVLAVFRERRCSDTP